MTVSYEHYSKVIKGTVSPSDPTPCKSWGYVNLCFFLSLIYVILMTCNFYSPFLGHAKTWPNYNLV